MTQFTKRSIDTAGITDWDSFHDVFAVAMGFPGFYGRNMDAWIDCMTSLDAPTDGMTDVHAPLGGVFVLELEHMADFKQRCEEIHDALVECVAFVNWRRLEQGAPPVLVLSFQG